MNLYLFRFLRLVILGVAGGVEDIVAEHTQQQNTAQTTDTSISVILQE